MHFCLCCIRKEGSMNGERKILLQVNVTANSGSTGRIAEQINAAARKHGWETWLAYGRNLVKCDSQLIHVGNKLQVYEHYAEHRLLDNDGLASRRATRQLIAKLKAIKPNIIHLHNIHDHWLNYRILFEYLNTIDTPIIWTQHDCWAFTGGCGHFSAIDCYQWKMECRKCPLKQNHPLMRLFEKTSKHFEIKKHLLSQQKNLTLVPVSNWLAELERQSFLGGHDIITIHNGIDLSVFQPTDYRTITQKYGIGDSEYVLGVANIWGQRKGIDDFVRLAELLTQENIKVVMVGTIKGLHHKVGNSGNIITIPHTENVKEMAALYSGAMMFCNLTYEDNYPTTNLEAMACGTPVLTYRTGGSVEAITNETGWIAEQGDVEGVANTIRAWQYTCKANLEQELATRKECRKRAEEHFNKDKCFAEYVKLYDSFVFSR